MNNYFPHLPEEQISGDKRFENPAFHLIGNRLIGEQSYIELLIEFLLILNSPKKLGKAGVVIKKPLPEMDIIRTWNDVECYYHPKMRLNQKLFSFLSNSPLASRPRVQRKQYQELRHQFAKKVSAGQESQKVQALSSITALFQGYHRIGSGRNWTAQSFLPISPALLAGETIWNEKKSLEANPDNWADVLSELTTHFSFNKHRFLARGGEFFFLQICNGLRQPVEEVAHWAKVSGLDLSQEELDPVSVHQRLNKGFQSLMEVCPQTFSDIADFIDNGLDGGLTRRCTDKDGYGGKRFVGTGWVNADSWPEGYLLAVELARLLASNCNLIEKIELLELLCGMHALRTLCVASSRVIEEGYSLPWPYFHMVVSRPAESRSGVKRLAEESVKKIELNIYRSFRIEEFTELREGKTTAQLNKIDTEYGPKLFRKHGKAMGVIAPKRGKGARFVLTEQLLRLLVLTCVAPGKKITYDSFRQRVAKQFGIVFNKTDLVKAGKWINSGLEMATEAESDLWVQDMLEAAGFLIHLSDACALIDNPEE